MSRTDRGQGSPRAVVHKRILDEAASSPEASMEAIADEVSGATTDLVDRVLEEYGDPCTDPAENVQPDDQSETGHQESTTMKENGDHATGDATAAGVDPSSLTDRQRETLRVVHDHPEWPQVDIAEQLGVSRATVSRRLNDIPGFEWADRESFTAEVFDDEPGTGDEPEAGDDAGTGGDASSNGAGSNGDAASGDVAVAATAGHSGTATAADAAAVSELDDRLDAVEAQIEDMGDDDSDTAGSQPVSLPPELAHKVVHACVHSDRISEDEELRLIEAVLES